MAHQFAAGEWIADGVLAALGEDQETLGRAANEISHQHANSSSISPTTMALESFQPQLVTHPVSQPLAMAETVSLPANSAAAWGTPHVHVAVPPGESKGLSMPNADTAVGVQSRSMALQERHVANTMGFKREVSTKLISDPQELSPINSQHSSLIQGGPKVPIQGPVLVGRHMQGARVMNDNRDGKVEAAPSKPRAMLRSASARAENSDRFTSRTEPRTVIFGLTQQDLDKWPCRRCLFVHRGGECEVSCIGCGSKRYDKHDLFCPFQSKVRHDDGLALPLKKELIPIKEAPSQYEALDPNMSSTMQLSMECQRRGFNPEFKYYRGRDEWDNRADLLIKDTLISGGGISYKSQKDARDALAPKGLEVVRRMGYSHLTGRPDTGRIMDGSTVCSVPRIGSRYIGNPSIAPGPCFPYRPPRKQASFNENKNFVPDLMKSAQSPPRWRDRPANIIVSAAPTQTKRLEHSHQGAVKGNVVVTLPANIRSHDARATVESAVAAHPQTSISLHFPANVSVEIAQAYGSAIGAIASSSRRRSRSRSPIREVRRDYRDRDRDREYRDRDSSFHQPRPSFGGPRSTIDAYRPSSEAVPRHIIERSRPRLSPPPKSKYYPSRNGRDFYSQGRLERR